MRKLVVVLVLLLAGVIAPRVQAQTFDNGDPTDSAWERANNWSGNTLPNGGTDATIENANSVTVGTINNSSTVQNLTIGAGFASTNKLTASGGSRVLDITGTLDLADISTGVFLGELILDGDSTEITVAGVTSIGTRGVGQLILNDNSILDLASDLILANEVSSSGGDVILRDGSALEIAGNTIVGNNGGGNLSLFNSSSLTETTQLIAGNNAGSQGDVLVTSTASITVSGQTIIGNSGGSSSLSSTLTVNGSSTVSTAGLTVGNNSGSFGRVNINTTSGTGLTSSSTVIIGNNGTGTLNLTNAGQLRVTGGSSDLIVGALFNGSEGTITAGGTSAITVGRNVIIGRFAGSDGDVTLNDSASLDASSGIIRVGDEGGSVSDEATLVLNDTATVSASQLFVGDETDSFGRVEINSSGGTGITTTSTVAIGDSGTGTLVLTDAGQLNVNGSDLYVGYRSDGEGTISAGGTSTITVGNNVFIGRFNGSDGDVTLNDSASLTASSGFILVGDEGGLVSDNSTLVLNDTATVSASELYVGDDAGSFGRVEINSSGGTGITTTSSVVIGNFGNGTLNLTNAGQLNINGGSSDLYVGDRNGSEGTITASGTSAITVDNNVLIGWLAGSDGDVTLNDSASLTASTGIIYVGFAGGSVSDHATLTLNDSSQVTTTALTIANSGGSFGTVTLNDTSIITVTTDTFVGLLGTGTLTMNGGTLNTNNLIISSIVAASRLNLSDGELTVANQFTARTASQLNWTGGTLQTLNFDFTTASETLVVPNGGTLIIDDGGSITNRLQIANGGTFTIGSSGSADSISINEALTFDAGSTTNMDIVNGTPDSIVVTGTENVTISGGTLAVTQAGTAISNGDTFTVIDNNGSGSTSGNFDSITDNLPRITFTGMVVGDDYILTATVTADDDSSFANLANPAESGLGSALDNLPSGSNLQSTIDTLNGKTQQEIETALRDLSGQSSLSTLGTNLHSGRISRQSLVQYLSYTNGLSASPFSADPFTSNGKINLAGKLAADTRDHSLTYLAYQDQQQYDSIGADSPTTLPRSSNLYRQAGDWNLWASPMGGFFSRDTTSNTDGYEAFIAGIQGGIDYAFTDDLLLGLSIAYTYGETSVHASRGNVETHSIRFGPYLSYENNGFYINAGLTGGFHFVDGQRRINAFNASADRDYQGYDLSTFARVGYSFQWENVTLGPLAGLEYTYLYEEDYTESGAGIYNLSVEERELHSLRTLVGFRLGAIFNLGNAYIMPELQVGWMHELLNDSESVDAVFTSTPGSNFSFNTADPERNSVVVQAGVTITITDDLSAFVKYAGEFNEIERQHVGTVGMRYRF